MRGIQFLRIRISVPTGASGFHPCVHKLCLVLMKFLVQGKNKQYPAEIGRYIHTSQAMTEAEHNRPNLKLFGNRPSASATELVCETIRPIVSQNIVIKTLRIVSFLWLLS